MDPYLLQSAPDDATVAEDVWEARAARLEARRAARARNAGAWRSAALLAAVTAAGAAGWVADVQGWLPWQ